MLGIYCRISKRKLEGKDTSIQTQTATGIAFATKNLLNYELYIDLGISGQKGIDERDSLEKLFSDIESKKITSVWVIDQARFDRNEQLWFDFQTIIVEFGIEFYIGDVRFDIENEDMRLMGNVMSAMNASFARRTGKKVKDSYIQRFNNGKWVGITPYGYTTNEDGVLIIQNNQEKIVKRIFQLSLDGIGAYTIANILNDEKVPVKSSEFKGKSMRIKDSYTKEVKEFERDAVRWRGNVISGIIRNVIYKGVWILNKGKKDELVRAAPIIIEPEFYDAVVKNLEKNKQNVGKREQYLYLINGLVFCSNCKREMRGKKRPKGKDSAYKCGGDSNCRGVNISKMETFIIHHLFLNKNLQQLLTDAPKAGNEILLKLEDNFEKDTHELKKIENKLKKLLAMSNDEDLADDIEIIEEYKKTKRRKLDLIEKIKELEQEIFSIKNDIPTTRMNQIINNFKLDMPFDIIKKSVHTLVKRIELSYNSEKRDFIMRINYAGFEETATFNVNYNLTNWKWISYHRAKAYTSEQLEYDKKNFRGYMKETFGLDVTATDGWEGGINEPRFGTIILEKDELIKFE